MPQSHQLELVEITGWPLLLSLSAKSGRLGESILKAAANGLSQNSDNGCCLSGCHGTDTSLEAWHELARSSSHSSGNQFLLSLRGYCPSSCHTELTD